MRDRRRSAVLGAALVSAALYCLLMPLWEGYDEPYHYGIVQWMGIERSLPDSSRSVLTEEVAQSILLAPAAPAIKRDHPEVMSFSEFRDLPPAERQRRSSALRGLPSALQYRLRKGAVNFEAQQPPLTYALLAVPDRLFSGMPLPMRLLALRLLIALTTVIITARGIFRLGEALEIAEPYLLAAAALVLLTQSFLATVCHVGNDWLAVAIAPWLFVFAIAFLRVPSARNALWLGTALAAGLLSKAHFLAFAAPAFAVVGLSLFRRALSLRALAGFVAPLLLAAPWYARNVVLYGSLSGYGAGLWKRTPGQILAAMKQIPWLTALPGFGRQALWGANNSGTVFSAATLNIALILLLAAAVLALRQLRRTEKRDAPLMLLSGVVLYLAALAYSIGDHYVMTRGAIYALMPWYCPPLFPLLAVFLFWGLARSRVAGPWIAAALLAVWTYVFVATWLVKLIPLYAGYPYGQSRLGSLIFWYRDSWREADGMLRAVALGPVWLIYLLVCVLVPYVILIAAGHVRTLLGARRATSQPLT